MTASQRQGADAGAVSTTEAITEITEYFKRVIGPEDDLGARLKFDYEGEGVVYIDGSRVPNKVHNRDEPADCTVRLAPDTHLKILHMELDQTAAFTQGKLKISGDVGVAVRLRPLVLKNLE